MKRFTSIALQLSVCLTMWLLVSPYGLVGQGNSASGSFPASWVGKWKGELQIFNGPNVAQRVQMSLEIAPTDTAGRWRWVMQYGEQEPRDYRVVVRDSANGEYETDEQNGIMLRDRLFGNKLISYFSVMGSTLVATYEKVNDSLVFEIYVFAEGRKGRTGLGTEDIPTVTYLPGVSRHYAVLRRE